MHSSLKVYVKFDIFTFTPWYRMPRWMFKTNNGECVLRWPFYKLFKIKAICVTTKTPDEALR